MDWVAVIGSIIELIFLFFKNKFEKDELKRKENDDLHKEAWEAIKSRDSSAITSIFDKLRN